MAISKTYTAIKAFREAIQDIGVSLNSEIYVNRLKMINSCTDAVFNFLHPLINKSYQRSVVLGKAFAGKKDLTGTASFAPTTNILTASDIAFTSVDVGKVLVMLQASSSNSWFATISSVTDSTHVVISSNVLPSVTTTMQAVIVPASTIYDDQVNLASLRINRVGATPNIVLKSTLTSTVKPISYDLIKTFNIDADQNKKTIVYTFEGETLYLRKGSSLASFGTMTLHYPAMPELVTANTSYIDLPDGTPIQLMLIMLKAKILKRLGQPYKAEPEIAEIVKNLFQSETADLQSKRKEEIEALL